MNPGHFSYLLEGTRPQVKTAADRLEVFAKTAAKRYLEEGAALNDTIKKIASENDLNSNQIERVCEMANISTHQGLWTKTAQKEKISFPLANSKAVIAAVQPATTKTAAALFVRDIDPDYAGPPKGLPGAGPSIADMFGVDKVAGHNGLTEITERQRISIQLQKLAAERQRLADRVLVAGAELETLEKKAFEAVKQEVVGGGSFLQLFQAASVAGMGKLAKEYFPQFEDRLIRDTHGQVRNRLEKQAISKAPEDLISDDLGNVTVINGAHPVLVSLDTINRKTGEIRNGLQGLLRIDDQVKVYNQQIRDLS